MEVKGLESVIKSLQKFGDEAIKNIEAVTEMTARDVESYAKQNAPVNFGKLGQSILATEITPLTWEISAGGLIAPYAPYVEFGTGGLVDVPVELTEIAIQFKGAGVRKINMRARPYLYPALIRGRKEYLETLKKLLKKYGDVK